MIRTSEQVDVAAQLLRQDGWTRRLARSLVSDDALADDLAQDTWVSALRRPPEIRAPLRPWLRKVVRHNLFNQSRLGRRREARERATGLPPDPASPEDLVGRGEIHRLLVEAVLALKEPYRQVVVLRYFDGLTSAQIAARTNVPPATARGRLKTALDLLREALRARRDGQRDWFEAVGDLFDATADAPEVPTAAPSSSGGASHSTALKAGRPRPPAAALSKPPARGLLADRALPVKAVVLTIVLGAAAIPVARRIASWNRGAVPADRTTEAARVSAEAKRPGGQEAGESEEAEVTGGTQRRERAQVAVVALARASSAAVSGSREASTGARPVTAEHARVASFQGITGRVRSTWQVLGARTEAAGGSLDRGGGLADVVVKIVEGISAAPAMPPPPKNLAVVRLGPAGFAPHVLVARVGQTIAVENDDVVPLDLEVLQDSTVLFKGSVPAASSAQPVAVGAAGAVIKLNVVTRPQLLSFVVTADNPFYATTDTQGRFFMAGVPPGAYVVEAWHESAEPTRAPVQVLPAGTGEVELVLNGAPWRALRAASRVPPGACGIAGQQSNPISAACRTGGSSAAKKAMKRLVAEGRKRGGAFTCEGCHADLDSYRLVEGAQTKLAELLRLVGS